MQLSHHVRIALILLMQAVLPAAVHATLTILPLGDSITEGLTSGLGNGGGYRGQLYQDLTNAHVAFQFAGSQTDNPSSALTNSGQVKHEGHGGYIIANLTSNLNGVDTNTADYLSGTTLSNNGGYWLAGGHGTGRNALVPDIILLDVGTNDIVNLASSNDTLPAARTRLETLVSTLFSDAPNAKLFISSIVPELDSTQKLPNNYNNVVLSYNALIPGIVSEFKQAPFIKSIYFVDQYSLYINPDGSLNLNLTPGGHPTQAGYNVMGDSWFNAIQASNVPEPVCGILLVAGFLAFPRRRRVV